VVIELASRPLQGRLRFGPARQRPPI